MAALRTSFLALVAVAALSVPAWGLDANDIVLLVRNGVGDEVIVNMVRGNRLPAALTADEVIRLGAAGASTRLMEFLTSAEAAAPAVVAAAPTTVYVEPPTVVQAPTTIVETPVYVETPTYVYPAPWRYYDYPRYPNRHWFRPPPPPRRPPHRPPHYRPGRPGGGHRPGGPGRPPNRPGNRPPRPRP